MEAFEQTGDGSFRVRRLHSSDAVALAAAVLLPIVTMAVLVLVLVIVGRIWGDDTDGAAAALIGVIA